MNFQHLTVLLPCDSLEEFVTERPEDESEQLLSAWSALWHPALVAAAGKMPGWAPASSPPAEPAGHLCVLPPCCEPLLPAEWLADAEQAGAQRDSPPVRPPPDRRRRAGPRWDRTPAVVEPSLAADFLALGFCHLAVELLTRKLRYMSHVDESGLESHVLAAAKQACGGDTEAARRHLQSAFDLLHHAREYFFPAEPRLFDLTLVASTTLGQSLRHELAAGTAPEPACLGRGARGNGPPGTGVADGPARRPERQPPFAPRRRISRGRTLAAAPGSDRPQSATGTRRLPAASGRAAADFRPPPLRTLARAAADSGEVRLPRRPARHARRRPLSHRRDRPHPLGRARRHRAGSPAAHPRRRQPRRHLPPPAATIGRRRGHGPGGHRRPGPLAAHRPPLGTTTSGGPPLTPRDWADSPP